MKLCADLEVVVAEVLSRVPRLLTLQDKDPDSPTRGCMHPAHWRDKSSEVADMRRQEAALALAWIWRHPFPGNRWQGDREILHAALRAMGFWARGQHKDGTFDEWYKNEHGYATTAFSSYAMALALEALDDAVEDPLRGQVQRALRRCGDWLASHDDWFKTNHQAVGVAALGAIGRVTGEPTYLDAASRNASRIIERMHPDGWSKEISGLDIGYTFLLSEYLGMHAVLTGETRFIPGAVRAFRFAAHFLHPDLTTGPEYGICGNPYFSRVAAAALAPHDGVAAGVMAWMERPTTRVPDLSATLEDDLRLSRYAYQPLLAALLSSGALLPTDARADGTPPPAEPLFFEQTTAEAWFPEAGLLAIARPGYVAWMAPCHGGLLRVAFRTEDGFAPAVVHRGYTLRAGSATYRSAHYGLKPGATVTDDTLTCDAPLGRTRFVMPPCWARFALRMATSLPWGHRWSRWAIDRWRARKGTALNQSTAGISDHKSPWSLRRSVTFADQQVNVRDQLSFSRVAPQNRLWLALGGDLQVEGGHLPDVDGRIPLSNLGVNPKDDGVAVTGSIRLAAEGPVLTLD